MNDIVFSGHQPNFLPYMGFFYKIFKADIFVLDDDVQYSSNNYHNSNFIKANREKLKITVPVEYDFGDLINQVKICYNRNWKEKLLRTIVMNYGKSPYFETGYKLLEQHLNANHELLSDMNLAILKDICSGFGFKAKILIASKDIPVPADIKNNDRNIMQCLAVEANIYYSGLGGKEYNNENAYAENGIKVIYSDYEPVKYKQTGYNYIENLSVIDYIFNSGFSIPENWRK